MTGVQTCALPICFPVTIVGLDLYWILVIDDVKNNVSATTEKKEEKVVKKEEKKN